MKNRNLGKGLLVLLFLLIGMLVSGTVGTAYASDIRGGDRVVIGQQETIDDDLVVFANTIMVNGTVNGDLIAFGNTISVNGTVNGSAVLAGQTVRVNGEITGTVYSGSAATTFGPNAVVGRNVMYGGYSLATEPGSRIARDLSIGAQQAVLAGLVG